MRWRSLASRCRFSGRRCQWKSLVVQSAPCQLVFKWTYVDHVLFSRNSCLHKHISTANNATTPHDCLDDLVHDIYMLERKNENLACFHWPRFTQMASSVIVAWCMPVTSILSRWTISLLHNGIPINDGYLYRTVNSAFNWHDMWIRSFHHWIS